jgi:hypothetical protein
MFALENCTDCSSTSARSIHRRVGLGTPMQDCALHMTKHLRSGIHASAKTRPLPCSSALIGGHLRALSRTLRRPPCTCARFHSHPALLVGCPSYSTTKYSLPDLVSLASMAQSTSIYASATSFDNGQYEATMDSTTPKNSGYQMHYDREEYGDLFPAAQTLFEDECIDPRLLMKDRSAFSAHTRGDATLQSVTEERHHIEHSEDPYHTAPHGTIASASSCEANDMCSNAATWSCLGSAPNDGALPESR